MPPSVPPQPPTLTKGQPAARRTRDATRTRAEILEAATEEFARIGYSGARIDDIADRTRTTKRMIYYYFGSKQGLYLAVLERAYADIRAHEDALALDEYGPVEALCRLIAFTFDYDEAHPEFIRLVATENIHHAHHIARSRLIRELNGTIVTVLDRVLERGRHEGLFRRDVDPLDVHLMISAFCFFRVANQHTFGAIFGRDLLDPARRDHYRRMLSDMVVAHLTTT